MGDHHLDLSIGGIEYNIIGNESRNFTVTVMAGETIFASLWNGDDGYAFLSATLGSSMNPVPEPGTAGLVVLGLLSVVYLRSQNAVNGTMPRAL